MARFYTFTGVYFQIKVRASVSRLVLTFNFVHIVRIQVVQDYAGADEVSPKILWDGSNTTEMYVNFMNWKPYMYNCTNYKTLT